MEKVMLISGQVRKDIFTMDEDINYSASGAHERGADKVLLRKIGVEVVGGGIGVNSGSMVVEAIMHHPWKK